MKADSTGANFVWTITGSTGWRGTGRLFTVQTTKRRAGKPYAAARMRGDAIVAHVRELQSEGGKLGEHVVPNTASFFGVHERTVWNALKADRKLGPGGSIDLGPMHFDVSYSGYVE